MGHRGKSQDWQSTQDTLSSLPSIKLCLPLLAWTIFRSLSPHNEEAGHQQGLVGLNLLVGREKHMGQRFCLSEHLRELPPVIATEGAAEFLPLLEQVDQRPPVGVGRLLGEVPEEAGLTASSSTIPSLTWTGCS